MRKNILRPSPRLFMGAVFIAIATSGCNQSSATTPTSPTTTALPLSEGRYMLSFQPSEYVVKDGALISACPGLGLAGIGGVALEVSLRKQGTAWVGAPTAAVAGDVRVQVGPGTATTGGGQFSLAVAGSMLGTGVNTSYPLQPPGETAVVLGASDTVNATITGSISNDGTLATGLVSGLATFRRVSGANEGAFVRCAAGTVIWAMARI